MSALGSCPSKRDLCVLDEVFSHPLSPSVGCHICGSLQHKRRDCPQRTVVGEEAKVVGSRTRAGASKMARLAPHRRI